MDKKNFYIEQEKYCRNFEKFFFDKINFLDIQDIFILFFLYVEKFLNIDAGFVATKQNDKYFFKTFNIEENILYRNEESFEKIILNKKILVVRKQIFNFSSSVFLPILYKNNNYIFCFFSKKEDLFDERKYLILRGISFYLLKIFYDLNNQKFLSQKILFSNIFNDCFFKIISSQSFDSILDNFIGRICSETKIFNNIVCYKNIESEDNFTFIFSKSLSLFANFHNQKISKESSYIEKKISKSIENKKILKNIFRDIDKDKKIILKEIFLNQNISYILLFEIKNDFNYFQYKILLNILIQHINSILIFLEQKDQIAELEKQKTISFFSSGILHYFNNFFQNISARLELLSMFAGKDNKLIENLSKIKESINNSSSFLGLFSFFICNKNSFKKIYFTDFLYNLYVEFQKKYGDCIDLEILNLEKNFIVVGDEKKLHFAVWQILLNSFEFSKKNNVNIKMRLEYLLNNKLKIGNFLKLSIDDIGIGIPEKILKYIFEPFFSTKDIDKKTGISVNLNGLGLPIARYIINSLGGFMNVTSIEGRGTTVKIILPIKYE